MYGFGFYRFDGTYILVLIGVVLSMLASSKVKSTFNKYSRVRSMAGITGAEAAERILRQPGIYDVRIEHISGNLTDHYDPSNKVLRLSDSVYGSTSVAASVWRPMSAVMRYSIRWAMRPCLSVRPWCPLPISAPVCPGPFLWQV